MKTKKSQMGGVLLSLVLALSVILMPCMAFADTADVALMLTVEPEPLDFTVTDSISMHATQGKTALVFDKPVTVTNTGTEDLKVSSIAITPASGWSVEASSTDFATADKTALGFTCNGHDFSGGAYAPGKTLAAGSDLSYTLAGQISANADLMSATQVASMVLTVEKAAALINFTIGSTSYQAEEGMTWGEWVDSSYNTGSFYINDNSIYGSGSYGYIAGASTNDIIQANIKYMLNHSGGASN